MRDAEVVRRLREAGAIADRQDPRARGGPLALHRDAAARRHPQPLEHRPHAGRLQRRRRGGRGGGRGPGRDRLRRRRLDPHPGRLDRPGRAEAAARPRLHLARPRGLQRAQLLRPAGAQRRPTRRCCSTRSTATSPPTCTGPPPPRRTLRRGGRPRARPPAGRDLLRNALRRPRQGRPRAPGGDRVLRRAARRARPRDRPRRPRLRHGRPDDRRPRRWPAVEEWLCAHGEDRSSAGAAHPHRRPHRQGAAAACRCASPAPPSRACGAAIGRVFERCDVVLTPTTAKPPPRIGALEGEGYWKTGNTAGATCPFAFAWNVVGWPGISVPAGFTSERAADRRPAARPRKRRGDAALPRRLESSAPKAAGPGRLASSGSALSRHPSAAISAPDRRGRGRRGRSRAAGGRGGGSRRSCGRWRGGRGRARTRAAR